MVDVIIKVGYLVQPGGGAKLPPGAEGQLVGYGPDGLPVAVDAPSGGNYDDTVFAQRLDAVEGRFPVAWSELADVPGSFPPAQHQHGFSDLPGLTEALAAKAPASSIITVEQVQDLVAAMFQSGTHTNASITYDDASGTMNITASGGGMNALDPEEVQDVVGALVTEGTGISVVYDDEGSVLRIALTGESYTTAERNKLAAIAAGATANAADAQLRDRATHTGMQPIASVNGLQEALDGKQPTTTLKTVNGQSLVGTSNVVTAVSLPTDAEAAAFSSANPGVAVFSRQGA